VFLGHKLLPGRERAGSDYQKGTPGYAKESAATSGARKRSGRRDPERRSRSKRLMQNFSLNFLGFLQLACFLILLKRLLHLRWYLWDTL
jgi:hypothetical protein